MRERWCSAKVRLGAWKVRLALLSGMFTAIWFFLLVISFWRCFYCIYSHGYFAVIGECVDGRMHFMEVPDWSNQIKGDGENPAVYRLFTPGFHLAPADFSLLEAEGIQSDAEGSEYLHLVWVGHLAHDYDGHLPFRDDARSPCHSDAGGGHSGPLTTAHDHEKKADVVEHPKASNHVGLLYNGLPADLGRPFIQSSNSERFRI